MYMNDHAVALGRERALLQREPRFVKNYMAELDVEVILVPFDPRFCHIDMIFNVIADKVCVACVSALNEDFLRRLKDEKWQIIETSPVDVLYLLGNCLPSTEE